MIETGGLWTHWHAHPDVLLGLLLLQGTYLLGIGPIRRRYKLADVVESRQIAAFTFGIVIIFLSLVSPLHVLSDEYLFSAHMFQHVLLTLIAPPLLIVGLPGWLIRPLLRINLLFRFAKLITHPILAFSIFNLMFSIWHIPSLYNLSVTNHSIHITEHLIFIVTAVIMWWPLMSNMPELPRLNYPLQMAYLFLLSVAQIIVFAAITFSSEPLYEWYTKSRTIWNISPLIDQQIGGIIMKIGSATLFLTLFVIIFFRWFNEEERNSRMHKEDE